MLRDLRVWGARLLLVVAFLDELPRRRHRRVRERRGREWWLRWGSVTTIPSAEPSESSGPTEQIPDDPGRVLTLEEIQQEFPENTQVLSSDVDGCLWDSVRIDFQPIALEMLERDAEPTGWEVSPIDISGADWAVVEIDPWADRDEMLFGSDGHESLLTLLQADRDNFNR